MSDIVTGMIDDLLPLVNEGFDWDRVKRQYDESPEMSCMSIHFTDESGEEEIEQVVLGIDEGPEVVLLDSIPDGWEHIGAIVTYQNFGLRILDPEDQMTPDRARYQYGGVSIHPGEGHSRERVWLVISNVLEVILETIIYQQQAGNTEVA